MSWSESRASVGKAMPTSRRGANAWDGEWYRRAYFDDGTPRFARKRGVHDRFDRAVWAVMSGARRGASRPGDAVVGGAPRAKKDGLVLLLTPPFAGGSKSPGYITGYLPGVRENGGQYTHAAMWAIMAMAAVGTATVRSSCSR